MKTFLTLCISCSLALATGALAQQPEQQESPKKEKKAQRAAEAKPQASPRRERGETKPQPGAATKAETKERAGAMTPAKERAGAMAKERTAAPSPAKETAGKPEGAEQRRHERAARNQPATKQPSPAATAAAATAQSPAAGTAQTKTRAGAASKPVDVQKIKAQHANFRAQPKPQQVPAVTFNQNYRIQGVERWQGPQYEVFRSYRPEWHDAGWYRSRYSRVELIGGGYYYFNNGYWYPAWGYDPGAQYYAYDAPIYVGHRAEPPDQVIADVQAALQEMGYYKGEVDGLLGPLTREALINYQTDHGLYATAVIDEPTLDSLGMS